MDSSQKAYLKEKIRGMPGLPTLSPNVMVILGYLREKEVNYNKVLGAINRDQVLVAEILKLINSGFYGLTQEITTVDHAVNLLGVNKLKELLFSTSIMEVIAKKDEILWLHSYSTFCLMEDFIRTNPALNVVGTLPLTMLMHDIGQVVLEKHNAKLHRAAFDISCDQRIPIHVAEHDLMGVDHAETGAWLMEFWDMTDETIIPIAYHHAHSHKVPTAYVREAALVQLADYIDCNCRDIPALSPSKELLDAAGILEYDMDFWQARQSHLIKALDSSNPAFKLKDSAAKMHQFSIENLIKENVGTFKIKEFDFEVERYKS